MYNKKLLYTLIFFLLLYTPVESASKNLVKLFVSDALFGYLGTQSVSLSTEKFIRAIIKETKIDKNRKIKLIRLSRYAIHRGMGKQFYLIDLPGIDALLIIDEKWFSQLSLDEKRFVIGHELMHLRYYHSYKKIIYWFVSLLSCNWVMRSPISLWTTQFLQALIGKACEYEADYECIKQLNCYNGAIIFLNRMKQYVESIEEELPQWYLLSKYRKLKKISTSLLYSSHPSFNDRIEYIDLLFS